MQVSLERDVSDVTEPVTRESRGTLALPPLDEGRVVVEKRAEL
jgi:hypothetical protein